MNNNTIYAIFGDLSKNHSKLSLTYKVIFHYISYFLAFHPLICTRAPLLLTTKFNKYIVSIGLSFRWTDYLPFCLPSLSNVINETLSVILFDVIEVFKNRYFSPHIAWPVTHLSVHILFSRNDIKGLLCKIFVLRRANDRGFNGYQNWTVI